MLRCIHTAIAILVLVSSLFAAPTPARADPFGDTTCDNNPGAPGCDITAGDGGNGGGPSGGGSNDRPSDGKCRATSGQEIPCEREGAWAGGDGCYYAPVDPSAATIAALGGQPAGDGGWYLRTCYSSIGDGEQSIGAPIWIAGNPPVVSPAVLARRAQARLDLPAVVIRMNPPGDQLVNLPIWMSIDSASWSSRSATASVPGVSVTATARPVRANWSMGDGSTIVCHGPGRAWTTGTDPIAASPDCGYAYKRSSGGAPGGMYTVTVTVEWEVSWTGAGQSGTVPGLTTTGQVQTRVQESQAVIG